MNSARILRNAKNEIKKMVAEYRPIDDDQTQIRMEVSAAVRGASAKITPEPPANLGRLSEQEFRQWKRDHLGWE